MRKKLSSAKKRIPAKKLLGKKPKSLGGGLNKKQRNLYKQIKASKTRKKTALNLSRQKPTGNTRRKTKQLKVSPKKKSRKLTQAKTDYLVNEITKEIKAYWDAWKKLYKGAKLGFHKYNRKQIRKEAETTLKRKGFKEKEIEEKLNKTWLGQK